ncbi:MAG: MinD/ParA family protein, partial [Candidatus Heimdallarchaeota archaeon]
GLFSSLKKKLTSHVHYLNDIFFNPSTSVHFEDVLIDAKEDKDPTESSFYVGLANPEPSEINKLSRLNRNQFMEAFRKILLIQEYLIKERKFDYVIIDTGPGFRFDVANAMVISDVICFVMKPSEADLEGTKKMLKSISTFVSDQTQGLIINRAVSSDANSGILPLGDGDVEVPLLKSKQEKLIDEIVHYSKNLNIPIFGNIPCLCDVSRGVNYETVIAREHPDHVFSKAINEIVNNVIK